MVPQIFGLPRDHTRVNKEQRWNDNDMVKLRTWRNNCPSATLSTKNLTWTALRANLGGAGNELSKLCHGLLHICTVPSTDIQQNLISDLLYVIEITDKKSPAVLL